MPWPVPVPAPPSLPAPCDSLTGASGLIAPGASTTAEAIVCAGITNCSGGGSGLGGSGVGLGVSLTGTVIFSLPGTSALRGGSGILLPPPPPPPPGPSTASQTISLDGVSG